MIPPQQILDDFDRALPGFATHWSDPDNYFREDDGTFTACGVYASASHYLRDKAGGLSADHWRAVGDLIESYFASGEELRGILGACLIENMEFEACSQVFSSYVRNEILTHFQFEGREARGN